MTKTNTKTMTNTSREHLQRAILDTCDLGDQSDEETWSDKKWKYKDKYKDNDNDKAKCI